MAATAELMATLAVVAALAASAGAAAGTCGPTRLEVADPISPDKLQALPATSRERVEEAIPAALDGSGQGTIARWPPGSYATFAIALPGVRPADRKAGETYPDEPLPPARYTAVLTPGISAVAGQSLADEVRWRFKVVATVDESNMETPDNAR
jgi:hypothetical protein